MRVCEGGFFRLVDPEQQGSGPVELLACPQPVPLSPKRALPGPPISPCLSAIRGMTKTPERLSKWAGPSSLGNVLNSPKANVHVRPKVQAQAHWPSFLSPTNYLMLTRIRWLV